MKKDKDPYKQYVLYSVAAHIALFLLFTVKVLFFPSENLNYDKVIRVDMVALPDKVQQPPPPPKTEKPVDEKPPEPEPQPKPPPPEPEKPKPVPVKPPPEPVTEPKKPEPKKPKPVVKKPDPKPPKEEQDSAIARLKAMKNLRDQKAAAEKEFEFKGNAISKGSGLVGIEKLHHNSYLSDLDAHIKKYWNLPQWLANGNYKATILLQIAADGSIQKMQFLSPSGNELFDQHVAGTLDKAEPLPPPPKDLVQFFANKGVEVRFPE